MITPSYHMRRKSRYMQEQHRQDSRSFKETGTFEINSRSKSQIRLGSGVNLAGTIEDNNMLLQTEGNFQQINYLQTGFGGSGNPANGISNGSGQSHNPSRSMRSGSEAPPMTQNRQNRRFGAPSSQLRVGSLQGDRKIEPKSTWEPNELGEQCKICSSKFNILKRKHHCRKCGQIVCASCSGNNWYVPGYADQKVRMCDQCYKEWMAYKVSAHNINKTSVFSSYFGNNQIFPNNKTHQVYHY